jgi:hypothetical protein
MAGSMAETAVRIRVRAIGRSGKNSVRNRGAVVVCWPGEIVGGIAHLPGSE